MGLKVTLYMYLGLMNPNMSLSACVSEELRLQCQPRLPTHQALPGEQVQASFMLLVFLVLEDQNCVFATRVKCIENQIRLSWDKHRLLESQVGELLQPLETAFSTEPIKDRFARYAHGVQVRFSGPSRLQNPFTNGHSSSKSRS